jgi:hypothetical protein
MAELAEKGLPSIQTRRAMKFVARRMGSEMITLPADYCVASATSSALSRFPTLSGMP